MSFADRHGCGGRAGGLRTAGAAAWPLTVRTSLRFGDTVAFNYGAASVKPGETATGKARSPLPAICRRDGTPIADTKALTGAVAGVR
jgi:hypothetical protein